MISSQFLTTCQITNMLKSEAHSQNIVSTVKKDIFTKSVFNSPDLVIICKNGVQLKMHRDLLCLFSPLLRDIFWSIQKHRYSIDDVRHQPCDSKEGDRGIGDWVERVGDFRQGGSFIIAHSKYESW